MTGEDEIQQELKVYKVGDPMSPDLLARMLSETDEDRLTDAMRQGKDPSGLWLAWLRS